MDNFEIGNEVLVRIPGFASPVGRGVITFISKEVNMICIKTGPCMDDWLVANFSQIERV